MSKRNRLVHIGFAIAIAAGLGAQGAQGSQDAGEWKTWVISSGKDHAVPPPPDAATTREELKWLKEAVTIGADPRIIEQIRYWDSGPPSYRWIEMIDQRQLAGRVGLTVAVRAYAYVALAMYDATIAAANAKRQYKRSRPNAGDSSIQPRIHVPASHSYPSDYAATAAAAATVMAYLIPAEAEYFQRMAEEAAKSRLFAGVELPSDYWAGMDLGRRVAEQVIAKARSDGSDIGWTGSVPSGKCMWVGSNPGNAAAANWKPLLLTSPSEFRSAPPPPCDSPEVQADLAAVRDFPRSLNSANLMTNARALYWQTPEGLFPWAYMQLSRWVLEDKLENDPAHAARAYALLGALTYDAFIASQDGKFAYWYIRPAQLDPSITTLFQAPNFPSYPSNHSTFSTARAEILAYLFPDRATQIRALGKEAGDSRIWAGIHFEMDNRAGVDLGRNIAAKFIEWAKKDGSGR